MIRLNINVDLSNVTVDAIKRAAASQIDDIIKRFKQEQDKEEIRKDKVLERSQQITRIRGKEDLGEIETPDFTEDRSRLEITDYDPRDQLYGHYWLKIENNAEHGRCRLWVTTTNGASFKELNFDWVYDFYGVEIPGEGSNEDDPYAGEVDVEDGLINEWMKTNYGIPLNCMIDNDDLCLSRCAIQPEEMYLRRYGLDFDNHLNGDIKLKLGWAKHFFYNPAKEFLQYNSGQLHAYRWFAHGKNTKCGVQTRFLPLIDDIGVLLVYATGVVNSWVKDCLSVKVSQMGATPNEWTERNSQFLIMSPFKYCRYLAIKTDEPYEQPPRPPYLLFKAPPGGVKLNKMTLKMTLPSSEAFSFGVQNYRKVDLTHTVKFELKSCTSEQWEDYMERFNGKKDYFGGVSRNRDDLTPTWDDPGTVVFHSTWDDDASFPHTASDDPIVMSGDPRNTPSAWDPLQAGDISHILAEDTYYDWASGNAQLDADIGNNGQDPDDPGVVRRRLSTIPITVTFVDPLTGNTTNYNAPYIGSPELWFANHEENAGAQKTDGEEYPEGTVFYLKFLEYRWREYESGTVPTVNPNGETNTGYIGSYTGTTFEFPDGNASQTNYPEPHFGENTIGSSVDMPENDIFTFNDDPSNPMLPHWALGGKEYLSATNIELYDDIDYIKNLPWLVIDLDMERVAGGTPDYELNTSSMPVAPSFARRGFLAGTNELVTVNEAPELPNYRAFVVSKRSVEEIEVPEKLKLAAIDYFATPEEDDMTSTVDGIIYGTPKFSGNYNFLLATDHYSGGGIYYHGDKRKNLLREYDSSGPYYTMPDEAFKTDELQYYREIGDDIDQNFPHVEDNPPVNLINGEVGEGYRSDRCWFAASAPSKRPYKSAEYPYVTYAETTPPFLNTHQYGLEKGKQYTFSVYIKLTNDFGAGVMENDDLPVTYPLPTTYSPNLLEHFEDYTEDPTEKEGWFPKEFADCIKDYESERNNITISQVLYDYDGSKARYKKYKVFKLEEVGEWYRCSMTFVCEGGDALRIENYSGNFRISVAYELCCMQIEKGINSTVYQQQRTAWLGLASGGYEPREYYQDLNYGSPSYGQSAQTYSWSLSPKGVTASSYLCAGVGNEYIQYLNANSIIDEDAAAAPLYFIPESKYDAQGTPAQNCFGPLTTPITNGLDPDTNVGLNDPLNCLAKANQVGAASPYVDNRTLNPIPYDSNTEEFTVNRGTALSYLAGETVRSGPTEGTDATGCGNYEDSSFDNIIYNTWITEKCDSKSYFSTVAGGNYFGEYNGDYESLEYPGDSYNADIGGGDGQNCDVSHLTGGSLGNFQFNDTNNDLPITNCGRPNADDDECAYYLDKGWMMINWLKASGQPTSELINQGTQDSHPFIVGFSSGGIRNFDNNVYVYRQLGLDVENILAIGAGYDSQSVARLTNE